MESWYSQYSLIILGVFLCEGPVDAKLGILFENWDADMTGKISRADFCMLWEDVYKIVVDHISILAKGGVNRNALKSYIGDLSHGKNLAH